MLWYWEILTASGKAFLCQRRLPFCQHEFANPTNVHAFA
jgi:hypothetical protein